MSEQPEALPIPDPKLIQRLFDEDPLNLSNQDIDQIIGEFRSGRMAYLNPPVKEPKAKAAPKGKTAKLALDLAQIDIEDLLG